MPTKRFASTGLVLLLAMLSGVVSPVRAKGDDFNTAVRIIEQFYHVRHKSLPWMARAGMKAATTAARISGGQRKRIAEAGSVKIAFFEDQDFSSRGRIGIFKSSMNGALMTSWSPLVQTLSSKDEEQTYIYVREANEKFQVLVVTIERREAVVVQATVNPRTLALLMQNPDEMGREITNDATTNDND
ncbi:MAG TPA: hypothetical protein VGJ55_07305 [Pyrinomonadaceae bacterium]|jgi:hypothetical protein